MDKITAVALKSIIDAVNDLININAELLNTEREDLRQEPDPDASPRFPRLVMAEKHLNDATSHIRLASLAVKPVLIKEPPQ